MNMYELIFANELRSRVDLAAEGVSLLRTMSRCPAAEGEPAEALAEAWGVSWGPAGPCCPLGCVGAGAQQAPAAVPCRGCVQHG